MKDGWPDGWERVGEGTMGRRDREGNKRDMIAIIPASSGGYYPAHFGHVVPTAEEALEQGRRLAWALAEAPAGGEG